MKFIRQFASDVDYQSFIGGGDNYVEPHIALIKDTHSVVYKRKITQPLITQTINLIEGGTHWVSFYLDTLEGENGLALLKESLGSNATEISTNTGVGSDPDSVLTYDSTNGVWSGNLTSIDLTRMYRIKCVGSVTIEFSGHAVDPSRYEITLKPGWNWIGYPVRDTVNVKDALANLVPSNGDVIKSKDWSMTYLMGQWLGVKEMTPGMGYMYQSKADNENKVLKYNISQ